MLNLSAALAAATRWSAAIATGIVILAAPAAQAEWNEPWKNEDRALVIDAYEFNPIDWNALVGDKRIAGFVNKASDGLPPAWSCGGLAGDDERLCKNRWWKYSVTQELYFTRRQMAKSLGLKWGAYHLARPGNPREQADHFVDFAKPEADELIAIDIEDNDPDEWMSLADAEIFAQQIKIRVGRYPVLYTNGSTAEYISQHKADYPLLSRLPLWYARYRDDITGKFPEETWPSYALWQFSSMHNCGPKSCPYRVKGAKTDIDVNVSPLTVAELKTAWPFAQLVGSQPEPAIAPVDGALMAEVAGIAGDLVADVSEAAAALEDPIAVNEEEADEARNMMLAAYGPAENARRPLDPLELLTQAAREEHRNSVHQPILSALTDSGRKVDPAMPGDVHKPALKFRSATIPTHDVNAGMLDAFGSLQGEMDRVRDILRRDPTEPNPDKTVALEEAMRPVPPSPEAVARSKIAETMRRAMAKGELKIPTSHRNPALVERTSALLDSVRGARPRASLLDHRIAEAFVATR